MSIFQQRKSGNKREIEILGLKFKYTKKSKLNKEYTKNNNLLNYYLHKHLPLENQKWYMRQLFYKNLKYFPNFDNPKTFNEKIHWLKLYYQNPLITKCCDKYAVKDYVKEVLGSDEYTVPTIAVYNSVNEIDFDKLPDKFVLKVNWSSGYNIIVKDKSFIDIEFVKAQLNQWIQFYNNSYFMNFNWGYKNMKPQIYVEEYIEQMDGAVNDYKFYCYNGEPKNLFVATNRFTKLTFDFYDINWKHLPFTYGGCPNSKKTIQKPKKFDKMVEIARKLAKPFPFVRVDFYEIGDKVMVGEMTFYSGGGLLQFEPREWDYKMGEFIELPEKMLEEVSENEDI